MDDYQALLQALKPQLKAPEQQQIINALEDWGARLAKYLD